MDTRAPASSVSIGLVAGGGALPFAVADAIARRGQKPVLMAIKGFCDPARVAPYDHHWVAVGQFGRLMRRLRDADCHDVVFIGSMIRPALSEMRLDWTTIRLAPRIIAAFRGGDDHLLTGLGTLFEQHGFRLVGVADVAPEIMMPQGLLTKAQPDAAAQADIAKGLGALDALSPFDVGQACVVIDGNIVAIEDIAGTDALLTRVAALRADGRLRAKRGRGLLVKAPKRGQDLRLDLPTLGPRTVEGVVAAELAGIAIVAGRTLMADPQLTISAADRAGLFVTGLQV